MMQTLRERATETDICRCGNIIVKGTEVGYLHESQVCKECADEHDANEEDNPEDGDNR